MSSSKIVSAGLLTPVQLVRRRISEAAISNYINAILLEVTQQLDSLDLPGCCFQISGLIAPGVKPVFEVQQFGVPAELWSIREELEEKLARIATPGVASGAVAFASFIEVAGGLEAEPSFFQSLTDLAPTLLEQTKARFEFAFGMQTPKEELQEVPLPQSRFKKILSGLIGQKAPVEWIAKPDYDAPLAPLQAHELTLEQINSLVTDTPDRAEPGLIKAEWHLAHQENQLAKETCDVILARWPDQPRAFYLRGCAQSFAGSSAAGLADFERAMELVPDYWGPRFRRRRFWRIWVPRRKPNLN